MSCIVGITDGKTVTFGADSAGGLGDEIYTLDVHKAFARGPYLFGVCGSMRVGQVLRFKAELPEPPATDLEPFLVRELVPAIRRALTEEGVAGSGTEILGDKTAILLGCRGQLWTICQDLTLVREAPYAAIGSGRLRAYGALHALHASSVEPARRLLEMALAAAAAYTSNVRPPWHFVSGGSV
jgi:hypothetical protein